MQSRRKEELEERYHAKVGKELQRGYRMGDCGFAEDGNSSFQTALRRSKNWNISVHVNALMEAFAVMAAAGELRMTTSRAPNYHGD